MPFLLGRLPDPLDGSLLPDYLVDEPLGDLDLRRGPEIDFVNPRIHRGEFFRLSHRLHHLLTGPSRGSCSNTRAFYLNTLTSKTRMRLRGPRLSPYASHRSSPQFVAVRCSRKVE